MKKLIGILIITILFILVGCSKDEITKHDYTYKGENDLWTAEYNVKGQSGFIKKGDRQIHTSDSNSKLTVTYKKDLADLPLVKNFNISYKSSVHDMTNTTKFDKNTALDKKTFIIEDTSKDSPIEKKDETIKVTIDIDGNTQTLDLKSVN